MSKSDFGGVYDWPQNKPEIDYNGVGGYDMPAAHTHSKLTHVTPGRPGRYIRGGRGWGGQGEKLPPPENTIYIFFSNIVFHFAGLFLVAILVRNLFMGDPFKAV